jgi:hypothetical protein
MIVSQVYIPSTRNSRELYYLSKTLQGDKCRQEQPSLMRSFGLSRLTSAHVDRACVSPVRGWKVFAKGYA